KLLNLLIQLKVYLTFSFLHPCFTIRQFKIDFVTLFVKNIKNNNNLIFLSPPLRKRGSGGCSSLLLFAQTEHEHPFIPSSKEAKD
ncbi:MAG: hypothetical protein ABFD07_07225, partial [Methanobacterium sp.]